jgi:hypothetical protein
LQTSSEQTEQRRLAVTVATDNADPVALVDAQGQRVEYHAGGELEMQGLGSKEMRHRSMLPGLPITPLSGRGNSWTHVLDIRLSSPSPSRQHISNGSS